MVAEGYGICTRIAQQLVVIAAQAEAMRGIFTVYDNTIGPVFLAQLRQVKRNRIPSGFPHHIAQKDQPHLIISFSVMT